MVLLRWLSSWFLISKRNIQVHQKDTLDLAIHSSCLKAPNDRGCLRLNQVLSTEFKVKSSTRLPPPPPPAYHVLEGNAFIGQWASNIKRIWHDKLKADMTSALTLQSKTNGQYHAFAAPSALKTEFKVKSSPWLPPPPQPSTCLRAMANGPQTLKEFDMTN